MLPNDKENLIEKSKLIFEYVDLLPMGVKKNYPSAKKWISSNLNLNINKILNENLFAYILEQNGQLQVEFVKNLETNLKNYAQSQIGQAYEVEQVLFVQKCLSNFDAHAKNNHQMSSEAFVMSLNSDVVNENVKNQFNQRFG